jgi:tetratricopeptide (TPR) repeat protein
MSQVLVISRNFPRVSSRRTYVVDNTKRSLLDGLTIRGTLRQIGRYTRESKTMKTAIRAFSSAFTLGLCLTIVPSTVFAQTPEERAGARSAARSGLQAFEGGKYADALDLFTRAENLVHAPTHLLYIARANLKLGRLVRAQEAYQQLIREKLAANAPQPFRDAQQSAEQELAAFEARIPMITVKVTGITDTSQLQVTMDGKTIPSALVGIPYPTDPGTHKFAAIAPGYSASPIDRTIAESARDQIELKLKVDPNAAPVATTATGKGPTTSTTSSSSPSETPAKAGPTAQSVDFTAKPEPHSNTNRILAYSALGLGAVGVGAGIYFLLGRNSADDDATKKYEVCRVQTGGCTKQEQGDIDSLDNKASTQGWLSIVSFSVGGLAAITGVTLLIVDGNKSSASNTVTPHSQVRVWAGPGSLGLTGKF